MKKGDIVLIPFPYSDLAGSKLRPALILISSEKDVTVCFITTQFQREDNYDFKVIPSSLNGLKKISLLKCSKFATLDKDLIIGQIGLLEDHYIKKLNKNLIEILQLN